MTDAPDGDQSDGFWDKIHRARFEKKLRRAEEITCEDCGETFPCETEEQRNNLSDGCPACSADAADRLGGESDD